MTEDIKKEIIELLENLPYWDTCPQNYKDRIPTMVKALKQGQSLPIDSVRLSFMDWLKDKELWLVNHGGKLNIHEIEQRYEKYINEA